MRTITPPNIRTAILAPFSIIVTLLLVFVISVYIAVMELNSNFVNLYKQSVPEIAQITSLIDEYKNIHIKVNSLLEEDSDIIFFTNIIQIKEKLSKLYDNALSKENSSFFNKNIHEIVEQVKEVKHAVYLIEKMGNESIDITRKRQNSIKYLRYLNQRIQNHSQIFDKERDLPFLLQSIITNLFVLNSSTDTFYNNKIYDKLQKDIRQLKQIQKDLSQNKTLSKEQNEIIQDVLTFATKDNYIVTLSFQYNKVQQEKARIRILLTFLYNKVNEIHDDLFNQIQVISAEQNSYFEDFIKKNIIFILSIFCLLFAFVLFIYRFISNYVLNPLTSLNQYIKEYKSKDACEIIHHGAVEVQEISMAVCNFATQLEDREQKLLYSHNNLQKLVLQRTQKIRQLSNQIISLQEEERFNLAAELHDDIGSSLGTIKLTIERALLLLTKTDISDAKDSLDSSIEVVKSIGRQLRRIQTDLRPPHLDVGLLKALEWHIEDYSIAHPHIDIEADIFFDDLILPSTFRIVTFRIVQEIMNNISKHSDANKVSIKILDNKGFTILIVDNGKGFDLNLYKQNKDKISCGIRNIQERVSISGGELKIYSKPGKGTRVIAHWKQENN